MRKNVKNIHELHPRAPFCLKRESASPRQGVDHGSFYFCKRSLTEMAECPSSAKQALEKLNEELTCSICLEQYTDPKLLHCFHVFCEKCLKPLACQTSQGQVVICPNCRQPTSLPHNGVPGLQGAFLIHHLFDIQDILKKVSTPATAKCANCEEQEPSCYCQCCGFLCDTCKRMHMKWKGFSSHEIVSLDQLTEDVVNLIPPDQKVLYCTKHPAKELDLYCETCQEVICRDCILKVHRDHQYDLATDAFPQQRNVLITSVEPVEQQLASVNKVLEGLGTLCGKITNQRQVLETQIRARMRLIHEALEAREEDLISQLDQLTQQKLKNVAAQQDGLELVATRLKSCCGFLQESLRTGSRVEVLAMTKPFVEQVQDVVSTFKPESLAPEEQADLEFFSSQDEMMQACNTFGQVVAHPVCHAKCHAEGPGLRVAMVGETVTATVHVVDQEGRKYQHPMAVTCELVSNDETSRISGEVKKVSDSRYEISYQPQHRGQHYLHIRVEDKHISGSPFPLAVLTTTPTNIINHVKDPWGLVVNNSGHVLVVEHIGDCVSVFSGDGKNRRSFSSSGSGPDQLQNPCGIALSSTGDILVCEFNNHRIHVFSPDGKSVKCVGTRGSGNLQFNHPVDIAVHPHSNKIYVTERGNNRVQILNEDLTFSSKFGSSGSGNEEFCYPRGVSIDSTGNVYVADSNNHRVQVFTANGQYMRQFGSEGSGDGELNEPKGIIIDSNDIVYISENGNHRISIFTREGHFLRLFGTYGKGPGQFKNPTGITVAKNGVIYISDCNNKRVQVF